MRRTVVFVTGLGALTACMDGSGAGAACTPDAGLGCGNELAEPTIVASVFDADPVTVERIEALDDTELATAVARAWVATGCEIVKGQGTVFSTMAAQRMALADQLGLNAVQRSGSANEERLDWALEDGEALLVAEGRLVEDGYSIRLVPCAA